VGDRDEDTRLPSVDAAFLADWLAAMTQAVAEATADFEERHGYPPGENYLGPPADEEALWGVAALLSSLDMSTDLVDLYRVTRDVCLSDIGNGYFIPGPGYTVGIHEAREPAVVAGTPPTEVAVFASDGGGTMYALPAGSAGPVLRLPPSGIHDGVYTPNSYRYGPVAPNLRDFLTRMLDGVVRFGAGQVTDL
jgi:hypothetical protein